jgi:hypothetical protein
MSATRFTDFALGKGTKAATATAGAATLNNYSGVITTEALTTAAAAVYTLTLTNPKIKANDIVMVTVANGTNSAGAPTLQTATPAAGSIVINIANRHASNALNGTLAVHFMILRRE